MAFETVQNKEAKKVLERLHPQEKGRTLYLNYQRKKARLMIGLVLTGFVSALGLHLSSRMETRLSEGAQLIRNEWGAGDYQINLIAESGEWSKEIPFLVEERSFTEKEKKQMKKQLYRLLPEIIKGKNRDLQHVTEDLNLVTHIQGYPFILSWSSDNKQCVDPCGKVNRQQIQADGEWVILYATVKESGQKESETFEYKIYVLQEELSEEERFFRILQERLSAENEKKAEESKILLPEEINGNKIIWKERYENNSIFIFLLFLLGSVLAGKGMDYDLRRSLQKRNRQLEKEYAGFVNKLRLYLSAGLTVRNSLIKITEEYGKYLKSRRKNYLYEELKISCFQLENGVAEEQVYYNFGQRCGEMRFRRLSTLLGVQLKQGNDQLLQILEKEADSALEEQKNRARKAGEEAGTKLLFPMMLMLLVVMFLILVPAYLDFGSI